MIERGKEVDEKSEKMTSLYGQGDMELEAEECKALFDMKLYEKL